MAATSPSSFPSSFFPDELSLPVVPCSLPLLLAELPNSPAPSASSMHAFSFLSTKQLPVAEQLPAAAVVLSQRCSASPAACCHCFHLNSLQPAQLAAEAGGLFLSSSARGNFSSKLPGLCRIRRHCETWCSTASRAFWRLPRRWILRIVIGRSTHAGLARFFPGITPSTVPGRMASETAFWKFNDWPTSASKHGWSSTTPICHRCRSPRGQ